ncbi:MAG: hypothetical protein Q9186_002426 [Xanthomendoza sp. 1 TL-2023]
MAFTINIRLAIAWLPTLAFAVNSNTFALDYNTSILSVPPNVSSQPNPGTSLPTSFAIGTDMGLLPDHQLSREISPSTSTFFDSYPAPSGSSEVDVATHIDDHSYRNILSRLPHQAHTFLHRARRDTTTPAPKCAKARLARRIGYYQVSNVRKRLCHRITPADIITEGLSHLIFAYAGVDQNNYRIVPSHPDDVRLYRELSARKTTSMQTWIAVGGYDFGNAVSPTYQTTYQTWQAMTSSTDRRAAFIKSVGEFMSQYSFQGVDLDWQYPSVRGSSTDDAANLVTLVREMRLAWGQKYGISATLPPDAAYLNRFDAKGMEPYVDFFGYLSYDLPPPPGGDGVVRPHTDIRDIEQATAALWANHLDAKKLNLGLSNYGRGYTLADRKCPKTGCKIAGPSNPGLCTNTAGLLFNIEIQDLIKQKGLKPETVPNTMSKQISWDDQWIGFDDEETMTQKTDWAAESCFGGTMIWSLDMNSGEGSGSTPNVPGQSSPGKSIVAVPVAPGKSTSSDHSGTSAQSSTRLGESFVPGPPIQAAPGRSTALGSTTTPGRSADRTTISSVHSGQSIIVPLPIVPGQSSADSSTSGRTTGAVSSVRSGQQTSAAVIVSSSLGQQTAAVVPVAATSSQLSSHVTTSTKPPTGVGQLPIPPSSSKSTSDHPSTSRSTDTSSQRTSILAAPGKSTSNHISTSSSTSTSSQRTTILAAPGKSTSNHISTSTSTSTSSQRTVIPAAPGKSTTDHPKTSSSTSRSSKASGPSSSQSGRTTSSAAPALVVPGVATIPSPTIAPGSMITEGVTSITNLIPLALAVEIGLSMSEDDLEAFSERPSSKRDGLGRRQNSTPRPEDVKVTLETLASVYASLGLLEKEVALLNLNSLPGDIKKVVEALKQGLPGMDTGIKDGINNLANSIKDPKKVNMEDIKKANSLLGEAGTVTRQADSILKPLTQWKAPEGSNDIILPGILTLPTPALGDNWKGTTIPGVLTVPSPTLHWDQSLLAGSGTGADLGAGGGGGGGGGGGAGGLLAGLIGLAKQAEGSVKAAGDALKQLNTGGLGAALDATLQDATEMTTFNQRFAPSSINSVVNARNSAKGLFANLNRVLNNIAQFINKPPQALIALKTHAPLWFPGGVIGFLLAGSNAGVFVSLPKPIPIPVVVATNTTNSTNAYVVDDFFLLTVPNTTVKEYQDFIRTLPDGGSGTQRLYEWPRQYQTYLGRMTRKQAEAVNKHRIVHMIGRNKFKKIPWAPSSYLPEKGPMLSRSEPDSNRTRLVARRPNWHLLERDPASVHLRMLSYPFHRQMYRMMTGRWVDGHLVPYSYTHELSSGAGATIYVFDRGFRFTHGDFQRPHATNRIHVHGVAESHDPNPGEARGDMSAALAAGLVNGVANLANLVGIKLVDEELDGRLDAEYDNWRWLLNDVQFNRNLGAWEHVLYYSESWDVDDTFQLNNFADYARWNLDPPPAHQADFFLPLLADCWTADVVTVIPAGDFHDRGDRHHRVMGDLSPQRFANPRNPLIVVGSVTRTGRRSDFIRVVGPRNEHARGENRWATPEHVANERLKGELTTFALGEQVDLIVPETEHASTVSGVGSTSLAAAQIAGLAAYFLALPGTQLVPGTYSMATKHWIVTNRRTRGRSPDSFDISHNNVEEILQYCIPGTLDLRPESPVQPPQPRGLGSASVWDLVTKLFKRQKQGNDTLIFDNDHLTNSNYSDLAAWGLHNLIQVNDYIQVNDPIHIQVNIQTVVNTLDQTIIILSPTQTQAPVKSVHCISEERKKDAASFDIVDMNSFIDGECNRESKKFPIDVFCITNKGQTNMRITAGQILRAGPVIPYADDAFTKDKCNYGLNSILNSCDKNNPDHVNYGGSVSVDGMAFSLSARKVNPDPKDFHCYSRTAHNEPSPNTGRETFLTAIQNACKAHGTWGIDHTEYEQVDPKSPLLTFSSEVAHKLVGYGFDETFCVYGFTKIMDRCRKNEEIGKNERGKLWGGQCVIENIHFSLSSGQLFKPPHAV